MSQPFLALTATLLLAATRITFAADAPAFYDVRQYGAKGDGKTLDTEGIQKAIDAAAAAGGGTVLFPAGVYPAFSIHLKSHITLHLDNGSRLLAAGPTLGGLAGPGNGPGGTGRANREGRAAPVPATGPMQNVPSIGDFKVSDEVLAMGNHYDPIEPNQWGDLQYQDFGHSHWHNSFLWGENLQGLTIEGPGVIDGNGLAFNPGTNNRDVGNKALALKQCRDVTLRDVTFFRGGHFCILATAVDNFTIDNAKFDTVRDAIDIVSCKNVRVSNCYVNSPYDDGICLKSDFSLGEARACENITITNCSVMGFSVGTFLNGTFDRSVADGTGRIKFGTESNGGFKNITISNIVFDHSRGLAIEAVDGAIIEDVTVTNLAMRDVTNSPIFIRLGDRRRGPAPQTPIAQIRRINISDVSCTANNVRMPVIIAGLAGHPIEDVRISNVRLVYPGGGTAENAARVVPEYEKDYPEPANFGFLPASAFFIRHVKGLEMHHVDVTFQKDDARPPLILDDVAGADFQHINVQCFANIPLFSVAKVTDFSTQYVKTVADMKKDKIEKDLVGQ